MNEVTTINPDDQDQPTRTARNALVPALVAGARPRAIVPTDLDQVWRFAQMVAKSGMAPKDMQKPEAITVAVLHGLEVGLTPLMALQRIAVINGRPSIWGDAAIGLVRASGLCEYVFENVAGEGDRMVALCRVKRKGEKEPIERTFSVAQAKKAGLWDKTGPWKQYPERMLAMRARAFTLRDGFADVLGGLYIAEELEEGREDAMVDITPARPGRPTVEPENIAQQKASQSARPLPPRARTSPQQITEDRSEEKASTKSTVSVISDNGLDIPASLDRRQQQVAPNPPDSLPDPSGDPEAFLKAVDAKLASFLDDQGEAAGLWWDDNVAALFDKVFPPDVDELQALWSRHERRWNR